MRLCACESGGRGAAPAQRRRRRRLGRAAPVPRRRPRARPGPGRPPPRAPGAEADRIVIGYSPPRPRGKGFAAMRSSTWWRTTSGAGATPPSSPSWTCFAATFGPAHGLQRLGGFDLPFGRFRREDWDWGVRGSPQVRGRLRARYGGARRFPHLLARAGPPPGARATATPSCSLAVHSCPLAASPRSGRRLLRRPLRGLGFLLLQREGVRGCAIGSSTGSSGSLPRLGRLFGVLQRAAYEQGMLEGRRRPRALPSRCCSGWRSPRTSPPAPPVLGAGDRAHPRPPAGRARAGGGRAVGGRAGRARGRRAMESGAWSRLAAERRVCAGPPAAARRPRRRRRLRPGPRALGRAPRGRSPALGCAVDIVEGHPSEHWTLVDRAVRASGAEIVAVPLPGAVVAPSWMNAVRLALDAERVAVAFGTGLAPGEAPPPLRLLGRSALPLPLRPRRRAARVVRRAPGALRGARRARPEPGPPGPHGPLLDLVERTLEAGLVVATPRSRAWRALWTAAAAGGGARSSGARRAPGSCTATRAPWAASAGRCGWAAGASCRSSTPSSVASLPTSPAAATRSGRHAPS